MRAANFYEHVFGFERMFADERLCALAIGGKQVLLLFKRGASIEEMPLAGGTLPPHDGSGQLHVAFSCSAEELPEWEAQLAYARCSGGKPHPLATRRNKSLFSRSRREPGRIGHSGNLADLLSGRGIHQASMLSRKRQLKPRASITDQEDE